MGSIVATLVAYPLVAIGIRSAIGVRSVWLGATIAVIATCGVASLAWGLARLGVASSHTAFGWLLASDIAICLFIYTLLLGHTQ